MRTVKIVLFHQGSTELRRCKNSIFVLLVNILTGVARRLLLAARHTTVVLIIQRRNMPTRCIVAGCNAARGFESGKGCSFHAFPKDEGLQRKWTSAVKKQRSDWEGPTSTSVLCSKHFETSCFDTEGRSNGIASSQAPEARCYSHYISKVNR